MTKECEAGIHEAKQQLLSFNMFVHYDYALPIVLAGDTSAYGMGTIIMPDGKEHPIVFASCTLSSSKLKERRNHYNFHNYCMVGNLF